LNLERRIFRSAWLLSWLIVPSLFAQSENIIFEHVSGKFIHYQDQADSKNTHALINRNVHRIFEDKFGGLWIGTEKGISKMDRRQNTFITYKHDSNNPTSLAGDYIFAIHEDSQSRLWFGSSGGKNDLEGQLSRYDREADAFVVYRHDPRNPASLSSGRVLALCEDRNKFLWVGTETGLNRFDPVTGKFSHYRLQPRNGEASNTEQIDALYLDNAGILWIGTVGDGLYRYQSARKKFPHFRHDPNDSHSLSAPIVKALCEDRNGNLWIGTVGGGLNRYDPDKNKFVHYRHDPNDPKSLSSDYITALCEDRRGYLWVATAEKGLNRWNEKDGTFIHYRDHYPQAPKSLPSDHLICLFEDSKGNLWVGTGYGVSRYDDASDTFIKGGQDSTSYLNTISTFAIHEDSESRIWICGWNNGVTRLDTSLQSYVVYWHDPDDPSTISSNLVLSVAEQRNGNLWFGTWGGGLNCFHRDSNTFTRYTSADGLPNDVVLGLLPDEQGNLWISTLSGLTKFNPESGMWKTYDTEDGIQSLEFKPGACHKGRSGRFYFGGMNGFNAFYPEEIKDNPHVPSIVLTSFKILDREISPQRIGGNLEQLREIDLSHDENYLSFEFVALDFINPRKNQYAYRLEGLDGAWIHSGTRRFASYTNLAPGDYVLRLKGSNNDGVWNEDGIAVKITIIPPPWKTWWAYALYAIAIGGLLYGIRRYDLKRAHLANALKLQRLEAQKLQEVDHLKSRFFANISHEFRTPLTLILGPLENLLQQAPSLKLREQYEIMLRNGRRLLLLINQLLDLAKLEAGSMTLRARPENIVQLLKIIIASFQSLAERKNLVLRLQLPESEDAEIPPVYVDRDKFEKIISNLLANAIKFTPEGGSVKVAVAVGSSSSSDSSQLSATATATATVTVTVSDTGIGIPANELDKIFDRFYQVKRHRHEVQGTGIGLALTKELVKLHGGEIHVQSEVGKGSIFVVRLPVGKEHLKPEDVVEASDQSSVASDQLSVVGEQFSVASDQQQATSIQDQASSMEQPVLLIVEDNPDMRSYLRDILSLNYRMMEARDGEEGLQQAAETMPDLIVSDVMMPKMDGFAFCQKIKTDERTSHIPVILLTARASGESRIEGLETGADDYLTKPFNARELQVRVQNLIEQRRRLRERFSREVTLQPCDIAITTMDELFLKRVMAIVDSHLSDADFSVEAFAAEVKMSRVQLHRKLKALTNQSVSEFMRTLRLRAAAKLLEQHKYTVSEVAYEVGFNNLSYFAKCFREEFGRLPSEYAAKT